MVPIFLDGILLRTIADKIASIFYFSKNLKSCGENDMPDYTSAQATLDRELVRLDALGNLRDALKDIGGLSQAADEAGKRLDAARCSGRRCSTVIPARLSPCQDLPIVRSRSVVPSAPAVRC